MTQFGIGQPVRRVEDRRFITGRGRYLDDISRPHQAHAVFLRSPHAHAAIRAIDASAARAAPGVIAVLTGVDCQPLPAVADVARATDPGEAGAIGSLPALINAIVDALGEVGIDHIDMPATSETVWRAIREASPRKAA